MLMRPVYLFSPSFQQPGAQHVRIQFSLRNVFWNRTDFDKRAASVQPEYPFLRIIFWTSVSGWMGKYNQLPQHDSSSTKFIPLSCAGATYCAQAGRAGLHSAEDIVCLRGCLSGGVRLYFIAQ